MKATDAISHFFSSKFPFNEEGLDLFAQAFVHRKYPKGTLLAMAEDGEDHLRFLEEGVVREYFAKGGKEMNTWFYTDVEFITDFALLLGSGVRKKFQECLTDVTLRVMPKYVFFEFMEKYECGRSFVESMFEEMIANREAEEFKHFSYTPDDLYLSLLEERPNWLQKIPLYHIATYLRMTPETLSRIRKRN